MKKERSLSTFLLTTIFVTTLLSIRNWPLCAEYGPSSLVFILLGAFLFLIPLGMVSAELATGWPGQGGVFSWIKEAFGYRMGVTASWFIWVSNVVWYPTILSFIAGSIAYVFSPELAENPFVLFSLILTCFWGLIFLNLKGTWTSSFFNSACLFIGTIFPAGLIIGCGLYWLFSGQESQISMHPSTFVPKLNGWGDLVFFTGILLGFSGVEMPAAHANAVKDPRKKYPRAIFYASILTISLWVMGAFSVSLVISQEEISLVHGILDALHIFLAHMGMDWALPLMSLFIGIGAIGGVSTWISGPSKTLLRAAQDCELPTWITKENKRGIPQGILMLQGGLVTILSLLFLLMPNLNIAFWVLTAMASQLYVIAYIILFGAAIALRYKHPHVERSYTMSRSLLGVWIICGLGILNALFAFFIGFLPPSQIDSGDAFNYISLTLIGMGVFSLFPLLIRKKKKEAIQVGL